MITRFSSRDLDPILKAYRAMNEAQARPTAYKNLTPQQCEELAKLSPSYKSTQIWGNSSNWICSMANRMMPTFKGNFGVVLEYAKESQPSIVKFETYANRLKKDINTFHSFDELDDFIAEMEENGAFIEGLSRAARDDGRARQCYSLLKNGSKDGNVQIVFEDSKWLIGYTKSLEYNQKFSAIGEWCHTGSYGNAEQYYGNYAQSPIFYILNKQSGSVMCASHDHNEVRTQKNTYPIGFDHNWDKFFTSIGLEKPMVSDMDDILKDYEIPDGANMDIYNRVDMYLVDERLFGGIEKSELYEDDYHRGGGNFIFEAPISIFDPNDGEGPRMHTRYSGNVDKSKYYTFEEFCELARIYYSLTYRRDSNYLTEDELKVLELVVSSDTFRQYWNEVTEIPVRSLWGRGWTASADTPLGDIIPIEQLFDICRGNEMQVSQSSTNQGYEWEHAKKCHAIAGVMLTMVHTYLRDFITQSQNLLGGDYGFMALHKKTISYTIDADQSQHLAEQINNGECNVAFEGEPDIFAVNLKGKSTFAIPRLRLDENDVQHSIAQVMRIIKRHADMIGQTLLDIDD